VLAASIGKLSRTFFVTGNCPFFIAFQENFHKSIFACREKKINFLEIFGEILEIFNKIFLSLQNFN
jgi:hypothetical protein